MLPRLVALALLFFQVGGLNFDCRTQTLDSAHQNCAVQFNSSSTENNMASKSGGVSESVHASGLKCVTLTHGNGARAVITRHGANVIEWVAGGSSNENILFVSEAAVFNGKKAIRGGIPLVFPHFGAGLDGSSKLPSHGFARISTWDFIGGGVDDLSYDSAPFGGTTFAEFELRDDHVRDESHESPWLNGSLSFSLILRVELSPSSLSTSLIIRNTHDEKSGPQKAPFRYQALFHTYYAVPDCTQVRVNVSAGKDCSSLQIHDKMQPEKPFATLEAPFSQTLDCEVDRIFHKVAPTLSAMLSKNRHLVVKIRNVVSSAPTTSGLMDTVVWNPWIAKSRRMGDFGDNEYKSMVCIEPGRVAAYDTLAPGQWARLDQRLFVSDISPKL